MQCPPRPRTTFKDALLPEVQEFLLENSPLQLDDRPLPDDGRPQMELGGFPTGNTRSKAALKKANIWLKRCLEGHKLCAGITLGLECGGPRMPKRLLVIDKGPLLRIRLLKDARILPPQQYVCLSHRWSQATEVSSLTRDRETAYETGIPDDRVYPLVRDAVEITYRLGFKYIWIDCFCICQDDPDDWAEQVLEMDTIYENAAVTISALSSNTDPKRGIFAKVPPSMVTGWRPEGEKSAERLRVNGQHPFYLSLTNDQKLKANSNADGFPLVERGWVYQERLCSRRLLHFTDYELVWECKEALSCECRIDERQWSDVKSRGQRVFGMDWKDIVTEYRAKKLTDERDWLPALSGIARRFGSTHNWTYLSGLWLEQLPEQLDWIHSTDLDKPEMCRGLLKHRRIPSWSWISVPGPVEFASQPAHKTARVISHNVVVEGVNPYGDPTTATLVIEGPCISATVEEKLDSHCFKLRVGARNVLLKADDPWNDSGWFPWDLLGKGAEFLVLILSVSEKPGRFESQSFGLALSQVSQAQDGGAVCYRRAGVVDEPLMGIASLADLPPVWRVSLI